MEDTTDNTVASSITFYDDGIRKNSTAVDSLDEDDERLMTAAAKTATFEVQGIPEAPVTRWPDFVYQAYSIFDAGSHADAQADAFRYLQQVVVRHHAYQFLLRVAKTVKKGGDIPQAKQEDTDAIRTTSEKDAKAAEDVRKALKKADADVAAAAKAKAAAEAKAQKVLYDQKKKVERMKREAKEARGEAEKIAVANQELKDKLRTLEELESQFSADDLANLKVMLAAQDGKEVPSAEAEAKAKLEEEVDALKKRIGKLERELKQKDARAARMSSSLQEEASKKSKSLRGSSSSSDQSSSANPEMVKELQRAKKEREELRAQLSKTQKRLEEAQLNFAETAAAATTGGEQVAAASPARVTGGGGLSDAVASVDPQQFAMITKKLSEIKGIKESIVAMESKMKKSIDKLTERFDGPFQEHYKPGFTGVMGEDPEMKAALDDMRNTLREKDRKLEDAHNKAVQKERECAELEKQLRDSEFGISGGGGGGGGGGVGSPTRGVAMGATQIIFKTKEIEMPTSAAELFDLVKLARDNWTKFSRLVDEFSRKIDTVRSTEAAAKSDQLNGEENSAGFASLVEDSEEALQGLARHKERVEQQLAAFNANLPQIAKGAMNELGSADVLTSAFASGAEKDYFRLPMEVVHAIKKARGNSVPKQSEALISAMGTSVTSLVSSMDMSDELPKVENLIASIDRDLNTMTCALLHKVLENQNKVRPTTMVTQQQVDEVVDRKLDRLLATSNGNQRPRLDYSSPLRLVHSNGGFLLLKQDEGPDFDSLEDMQRRPLGPVRGGRAASSRAASRRDLRDERDEDFLEDGEDDDEDGMLPSSVDPDEPTSGYDRLVADLKKINQQKLEAEIELQNYHRQVYDSSEAPPKKSRFPKIRQSSSNNSSPSSDRGNAYAVI